MPKAVFHERFKTYKNVFDQHSERLIFKLISEGYFEGLKSPISIGKEANIFSAEKKDGSQVIVKIYRLQNCNFNKMYQYIQADPRFPALKKQRRKIIFSWVQREYRNLLKAREAGARVPTPFTFADNILVIEFIGDKDAAPMLKDSLPSDMASFFNDIVENMKKMYKAGLVHADLSAFNILNFNDKPVFIDFSQGTVADNTEAESLLKRDVKNICIFFRKYGLNVDEEKVLKKIKGK